MAEPASLNGQTTGHNPGEHALVQEICAPYRLFFSALDGIPVRKGMEVVIAKRSNLYSAPIPLPSAAKVVHVFSTKVHAKVMLHYMRKYEYHQDENICQNEQSAFRPVSSTSQMSVAGGAGSCSLPEQLPRNTFYGSSIPPDEDEVIIINYQWPVNPLLPPEEERAVASFMPAPDMRFDEYSGVDVYTSNPEDFPPTREPRIECATPIPSSQVPITPVNPYANEVLATATYPNYTSASQLAPIYHNLEDTPMCHNPYTTGNGHVERFDSTPYNMSSITAAEDPSLNKTGDASYTSPADCVETVKNLEPQAQDGDDSGNEIANAEDHSQASVADPFACSVVPVQDDEEHADFIISEATTQRSTCSEEGNGSVPSNSNSLENVAQDSDNFVACSVVPIQKEVPETWLSSEEVDILTRIVQSRKTKGYWRYDTMLVRAFCGKLFDADDICKHLDHFWESNKDKVEWIVSKAISSFSGLDGENKTDRNKRLLMAIQRWRNEMRRTNHAEQNMQHNDGMTQTRSPETGQPTTSNVAMNKADNVAPGAFPDQPWVSGLALRCFNGREKFRMGRGRPVKPDMLFFLRLHEEVAGSLQNRVDHIKMDWIWEQVMIHFPTGPVLNQSGRQLNLDSKQKAKLQLGLDRYRKKSVPR